MTNVLIKGPAYMKITVNAITGTVDVKHQQGQIMSSSLLHPIHNVRECVRRQEANVNKGESHTPGRVKNLEAYFFFLQQDEPSGGTSHTLQARSLLYIHLCLWVGLPGTPNTHPHFYHYEIGRLI